MDKLFFIVKISRILCIESVLRLLRVGVLLGLMAWFMQLVVFIQPLLPGGTLPGMGVCLTIIDATHALLHDNHDDNNSNNHQHQHMQHMNADMSAHAHTGGNHASGDHYLSHLSCGFCSLFGHALPATLTAPVWLEATQRLFITLPAFTDQSIDVLNIAYLHPKSRAPPFFI